MNDNIITAIISLLTGGGLVKGFLLLKDWRKQEIDASMQKKEADRKDNNFHVEVTLRNLDIKDQIIAEYKNINEKLEERLDIQNERINTLENQLESLLNQRLKEFSDMEARHKNEVKFYIDKLDKANKEIESLKKQVKILTEELKKLKYISRE